MEEQFKLVGLRQTEPELESRSREGLRGKPVLSAFVLLLIVLACLFCRFLMTKDPGYMDLAAHSHPPDAEFLFGTDAMGRDIFSMIWYGGRLSLSIGLLSTFLSTLIAVIYGTLSGLSGVRIDGMLMRFLEILLSVPNLLMIVLLQAIFGRPNVFSISLVIGMTSWMSIAKIVRTEVRQLRGSEYILAARSMGGGFWHILWNHLLPNFVSSIMFMVVMNVRSAIVAESTLSFMGVGLPIEVVSWGSMLSLAEQSMMTGAWWSILIPGFFLIVTLLCITNLGHYLRWRLNRRESQL